MGKETIKIFIASSAELEQDRKAFRELLSTENDRLYYKGLYLELVQWEYFFNAVSQTGKQDDYNQKLKECDIVICLFYKKAGKYTQLEFDTALKQFHETGAPLIYTYFKEPDGSSDTGIVQNEPGFNDPEAEKSRKDLLDFKARLSEIGHFYTRYTNIDNLKLQFLQQLDLLRDKGYEKLQENVKAETKDSVINYIKTINVTNNTNVQGDNTLIVQGGTVKQTNIYTTVYNEPTAAKEWRDVKPSNRFLCKSLVEALRDLNPRARKFLDIDIALLDDHEIETWENNESCLKKAKGILIASFPSVLGVFLSNLIASEKQREYFELGLTMAKRTLQLLCFAFISSFWDLSKDKEYQVTPDQLKQFRRFFYAGVEPSITFYLNFLKALINLFQANQLDYPIAEIKTLESDFISPMTFNSTCETLDAFRAQFEKDESLPPVDEFERVITAFLVSVKFLASYKMVSVKNIGYEAIRNKAPQYVHACNVLGLNNANMSNGEKYMFQDKAINTDAVLLYKDNYLEGLNLFPFIIDINALKDEDLARIYFYACNDDNEKTITYFETYKTSAEMKNAPDVVIEFNKEFEEIEKDLAEIRNSEDRDITDWMKEKGKKFKTVKMYEVYKAFQHSRECIFGKEDA